MENLSKSLATLGVERRSQLTAQQKKDYFELLEVLGKSLKTSDIWEVFVQCNYQKESALEFLLSMVKVEEQPEQPVFEQPQAPK